MLKAVANQISPNFPTKRWRSHEELSMALFSNEPEKNARPEPPKPQAAPAPSAPVSSPVAEHPVAHSAAATAATGSAYLDRGAKISGKLHFEGPARIDGQVDGEIAGKDITIGESAVVTAQITGESIIVCGKVKGEITASQRLEIRPTAKVSGNISAPKLIVQEGAVFEGNCAMGHEASHDDRKSAHRNGMMGENRPQA
jgi:cytoskeletal protein CcmA (bactofilin family)